MPADEIVAAFRTDLAARERAAERELLTAYIQLRRDIQDSLTTLSAKIATAEAPTAAWLRQQAEYRQILDQVEGEIDRLAGRFGGTVGRMGGEATRAGTQAASALLIDAGLDTVRILPRQEIVEATGRLRRGAPLDELLSQLGPAARDQVSRKILESITEGWSPRRLGREISDALGGNLTRAMRIARTEQMGIYRSTLLTQYRQQSRLLGGWVWHAQLGSERTCPVCIAMHGREFPLGTPFASHPLCRCVPVPVERGGAVGFETGPEWFAGQDADYQRSILGPAAGRAFESGAIDLDDLVMFFNDPTWGPGRRRRSLSQILGNQAREFYRAS